MTRRWRYTACMNWLPATSLLLGLYLAAGPSMAQWIWVDAQGRKVFSDTAPPADIQEKQILKSPGTLMIAPAAPAAAPVAPAMPSKDSELEKRKKEQEAQEAAKRKEAEAKQAAARKDNCARAQRALAALESGRRIQTTNAQGEAEIMSDDARSAEIKRVQGIAKSDCKDQ